MDYGTVNVVDPGSETPAPALADPRTVEDHRRNPVGETTVFRSCAANAIRGGGHRQARWHSATTEQACPSTRWGMAVATRTPPHRPAQSRKVRAVPIARRNNCPPRPTIG